MPGPKRTPERKSRSGSYVHEEQRHTERVVLRLPPPVATELRLRACATGQTISGYIASLVAPTDSGSEGER